MNQQEKDIISYLMMKKDWVTSDEIARHIGISIRTLRSRIKSINYESLLIVSSNKGYKISDKTKNSLDEYIYRKEEYKDFTVSDRKEYIIKLLLLHKKVEFYEMVENLHISESTLFSDLSSIRKRLLSHNLMLIQKNGELRIDGTENNVRKMISELIYQEAREGLLNLNMLDQTFPDYKVLELRKVIIEEIAQFDLVTNDYNIINIILHFCIILDRIKYSSSIDDMLYVSKEEENEEDLQYQVTRKIVKKLSSILLMPFEKIPIEPFYLTIQVYTQEKTERINKKLCKYNDRELKEIMSFCRQQIILIRQNFYVEINSDTFLNSFSYHLMQLIKHKRNSLKNPLYQNIKDSYPVIFEIAAYISKNIREKWKRIEMGEHEISYVAIHVGMGLEKTCNKKTRVILINPEYYNLNQIMIDKILTNFRDEVDIVNVYSDESDIGDDEYDIVLSTSILTKRKYLVSEEISIFINQNDIKKIRNCLELVHKQKYISNSNRFNYLFHENLFCIIDEEKEIKEEDVIRKLCEILIVKGYEEKGYVNSVLEREKTSSTSFANIAIPHSFDLNAKKSAICVGVLKKPIKWGSNQVNIVFQICIAKEDKLVFIDLIKVLIQVFSNEDWNRIFNKIKTFEDFYNYLKNAEVLLKEEFS